MINFNKLFNRLLIFITILYNYCVFCSAGCFAVKDLKARKTYSTQKNVVATETMKNKKNRCLRIRKHFKPYRGKGMPCSVLKKRLKEAKARNDYNRIKYLMKRSVIMFDKKKNNLDKNKTDSKAVDDIANVTSLGEYYDFSDNDCDVKDGGSVNNNDLNINNISQNPNNNSSLSLSVINYFNNLNV